MAEVAIVTESCGIDTRADNFQEWEGLGRLPDHLPSLGSLLLFNTDDNPYNVYASIDNLLGTEGKALVTDTKKLAEAPTTVATGEELVCFFIFPLFYIFILLINLFFIIYFIIKINC